MTDGRPMQEQGGKEERLNHNDGLPRGGGGGWSPAEATNVNVATLQDCGRGGYDRGGGVAAATTVAARPWRLRPWRLVDRDGGGGGGYHRRLRSRQWRRLRPRWRWRWWL